MHGQLVRIRKRDRRDSGSFITRIISTIAACGCALRPCARRCKHGAVVNIYLLLILELKNDYVTAVNSGRRLRGREGVGGSETKVGLMNHRPTIIDGWGSHIYIQTHIIGLGVATVAIRKRGERRMS